MKHSFIPLNSKSGTGLIRLHRQKNLPFAYFEVFYRLTLVMLYLKSLSAKCIDQKLHWHLRRPPIHMPHPKIHLIHKNPLVLYVDRGRI